jgi:RNA polymerase sigma-70 factor (ECF subfamily)
VRTWLYQIATNRCLTELGKRGRRMLPSGIYEPEPDPGSYREEGGAEVSWLQPLPDALVIPESSDPAAVVAAREGATAGADRQPAVPAAEAAGGAGPA